jgi:hypothetical protein
MQLKAKPTPPLRLQSRSYTPARKNRLKSLPISAEGGLKRSGAFACSDDTRGPKQRPETLLRNQAGKKSSRHLNVPSLLATNNLGAVIPPYQLYAGASAHPPQAPIWLDPSGCPPGRVSLSFRNHWSRTHGSITSRRP